ncbi:hypothetical protein FOA52_000819 [Chlamydomonas sp. UWO 241]|nr:hypothetical protein FOA52_000819 [Chlamydomonas sp. UWO 241]
MELCTHLWHQPLDAHAVRLRLLGALSQRAGKSPQQAVAAGACDAAAGAWHKPSLRTHSVARATPSGGDSGPQESSSFNSNLKGFKPVKKTPSKRQQSSTAAEGDRGVAWWSPTDPEASGKKLAAPAASNRIVLGGDGSLEGWLAVDKKVNKYPSVRLFTAIGTGGDEFRASMVQAVEAAVGPGRLQPDSVTDRPSSGGAYLAVKISVTVQSPDEVVVIYSNIKKDTRLKWCM